MPPHHFQRDQFVIKVMMAKRTHVGPVNGEFGPLGRQVLKSPFDGLALFGSECDPGRS
jgi:hypothetical protein